MPRHVSIVEARRALGRLAEEVRKTGQPVVLTRRGSVVAHIAPARSTPTAGRRRKDPFAELRGTVQLLCSVEELQAAIRALRAEGGRNLERRAAALVIGRKRRRA
jgi:antitoxin (DNA-binding transcriptional repressor) of toxin-antitoxin stability system